MRYSFAVDELGAAVAGEDLTAPSIAALASIRANTLYRKLIIYKKVEPCLNSARLVIKSFIGLVL